MKCLESIPRGTRPVGYGMIGFNIGVRASRVSVIVFEDPRILRGRPNSRLRYEWRVPLSRSYRTLTGRFSDGTVSRHFVPGYLN
jgi:hypothetical protein